LQLRAVDLLRLAIKCNWEYRVWVGGCVCLVGSIGAVS